MIEIVPATAPPALDEARALVRAHIDENSTAHDDASASALVAALPRPYLPPGGGLWVARRDGAAAGCVALQALGADVAEVKRMYVRPAHRGHGVARALAVHVIDEARRRGYRRLCLGTLTTMIPAQRLYESLGFRPTAAYRPVEFGDTLFFERALDDAAGWGGP